MTPDEFRQYGRMAIDWIADYWEHLDTLPVDSSVAPGQVRAKLPAHAPETGTDFAAILHDLDELLPGLVHWQHPRFFGYFPSNASGPAVLADLLASGLGIQGMSWNTSPACTELETLALDWLAESLGLEQRFHSGTNGGGVIQDTASSSMAVVLLAALHRASGGAVRRDGVGNREYAVYISSESHSAARKAVAIAGLGERALHTVDVDPDTQRMNPVDLREKVEEHLADGIVPLLVVGTVGTTSTGAVDPIAALGAVCAEHDIWLHIDAAYAGVAAVCPEHRWINDGVTEFADSYCTNPHKWLLTNFDCDALWVADRATLVGALTVLPEFLRNAATESGAVIDYRDWQIPLGRRFRALKLWSVQRCYGLDGLREHIREGVRQAAELAERVVADSRFELVGEPHFSLVCFRIVTGDEQESDALNERLLERINRSGFAFLSHTRVHGRHTLRLAAGGTRTELVHVTDTWEHIQRITGELLGERNR